MQCKDCVFYRRDEHGIGRCHRYAPRPVHISQEDWVWPAVDESEWCGEFRAAQQRVQATAANAADGQHAE